MRKILVFNLLILLFVSMAFGQKAASKKTIFAVVNDGKTIEPIAYIENKKLVELGESASGELLAKFVTTHYKAKTKYNLVFGGINVGNVTVQKDLKDSECAANQAEILTNSKWLKPKGFKMALATNAVVSNKGKGVRELPSKAERTEIENLVMAEMKSNNVPIKNIGELRYHNLTKIDVGNDKKYEFVGTYWYETGAKKRSLLFFIAEKNADGKMILDFKSFKEYDEADVMSGDIKTLDGGTYHELLIDMFDYDGDGQTEIFTMVQGFEVTSFNAYKRADGKWSQVLETSNYHCGF